MKLQACVMGSDIETQRRMHFVFVYLRIYVSVQGINPTHCGCSTVACMSWPQAYADDVLIRDAELDTLDGVVSGELVKLTFLITCDAQAFRAQTKEFLLSESLHQFLRKDLEAIDINNFVGHNLCIREGSKFFEILVEKWVLKDSIVELTPDGIKHQEGGFILAFIREWIHSAFKDDRSRWSACHRGHGRRAFGKLRIKDVMIHPS